MYQKTVGGRVSQRYFKKWENAKKALLKDKDECERYGWIVTSIHDYFNRDKGFYVYQADGRTDQGEAFTLSLLDCYFED